MSKTNPLAIQVPPGTIVEGRFLFETLSMGRYSTVFKVEDILDNRQKYCLKAEYDRGPKVNYLHQEIAVLNKLATRGHMARLYYCERCDPFSFMLTTLFGQSIWAVRQNLPNKLLSPGCAARIAVHTLYQIKQIHEVGFILRDLKAGDMLLGLNGNEAKMVFLVDFGMCRSYIRKGTDGSLAIRPPREKAFIRGILRYCSPRVHRRLDVCRADDLWSLVYVLVDLTSGLPWRDFRTEKPVAEEKEKLSDKSLFKNCPEEWIKIMEHVRSLRYESRPDYKFIYDCLQETLVRFQASYSDPWDWELLGSSVIIDAGSQEKTDSSKSDRAGLEMITGRDESSPKTDQNEDAQQEVPQMQGKDEVRPEMKNPFKEIISALQKSTSRAPVTASRAPVISPKKQKRISAAEYDPSFPTTNPEEFQKNDIGI